MAERFVQAKNGAAAVIALLQSGEDDIILIHFKKALRSGQVALMEGLQLRHQRLVQGQGDLLDIGLLPGSGVGSENIGEVLDALLHIVVVLIRIEDDGIVVDIDGAAEHGQSDSAAAEIHGIFIIVGDGQTDALTGHASIRFDGPLCPCGNHGCLDLYANIQIMRKTMKEMAPAHPVSPLTELEKPQWEDFMGAAQAGDALALAVVDVFCRYVCYALTNLLGALDVSTVIVGYPAPEGCQVVEELLDKHLRGTALRARREIRLAHSSFLGDAPLIGAAALVADKIFRCELEI